MSGLSARKPGDIVLLNGTSSAGKSSIARALQEIMEVPYLHTGIDHFLPRIPTKFTTITADPDEHAEYFAIIDHGEATRIVAECEGGESVYAAGTLRDVRIGPGGLALLAGMYHSIAALAAAGIDVIVDDVIHDPRVLKAAIDALPNERVLFVGLRLPREIAERRERERGDRGPGGATVFYDRVHAHASYDLELDTASASPMQCATTIKRALHSNHPRQAFRTLARQLAG